MQNKLAVTAGGPGDEAGSGLARGETRGQSTYGTVAYVSRRVKRFVSVSFIFLGAMSTFKLCGGMCGDLALPDHPH